MKPVAPYSVVFVDSAILVVNKKSGLLVAADRYDADAMRLDNECEKEFGKLFAVHRIDKDTSGLVIYARNEAAHRSLSMAFEGRQVEKTYHALVYGRPSWTEFTADWPLLPDGDQRHRTIVSRQGKPSETLFTLIGVCGPYSWIMAEPITGRTHQIRAHLAACRMSIVCDPLYGGNQKVVLLSEIKRSWQGDPYEERPLLDRLGLHAYKLVLSHPETGEQMEFVAPYPKDMDAVRKQLAKIYKVDPLK